MKSKGSKNVNSHSNCTCSNKNSTKMYRTICDNEDVFGTPLKTFTGNQSGIK